MEDEKVIDETPEGQTDTQDGAGDAGEGTQGGDADAGSTSQAGADSQEQPQRSNDPTANMTVEQKVEYYQKRAGHFEKEYRTERTKRQEYSKKYGGLTKVAGEVAKPPPANGEVADTFEGVQDVETFAKRLLEKAEINFEKKFSEKQLDTRVETTETRARDIHNGSDGLPAYDEIVDEFVVPMIQKNPKIFELIRLMPDPAEASYTLGFILKYPKFNDMIKSQSRDDLVKNINSTAKRAATVQGRNGGRQTSGKLTKAEIDAMNPEDFEKELEKFKATVPDRA